MILQPINLLLSAMALGGAVLAALQALLFSVAPPATAMTVSLEQDITEVAVVDEANKHVVGRASDGLFYVNGSINGVDLRFAVDTGASVVVLNNADAKRVGLGTQQGSRQRIRTASGYGKMTWRKANDLTIAGKAVGSLDVAVMDGGPEFSLLGLNALSRLGSITIQNDQLIIE